MWKAKSRNCPLAVPPSRAAIDEAARSLTGEIQQRPPAFSALKVAGRRAYAKARAGESFELAPRAVQIYRLSVVEYAYPRLCLEIECGSGTYVRSLGRDLAELAGTGAVMSALTRTAIGRFTLADALDPQQLSADNVEQALLPAQWAVQDLMPMQPVTADDVARLANGLFLECPAQAADVCAAVDAAGRLVAILERREAVAVSPGEVLSGGVIAEVSRAAARAKYSAAVVRRRAKLERLGGLLRR